MQLTMPLLLAPEYREYVWGGERLRPGQLTAESWTVYEGDRIINGALAGRTLAEVGEENPAGLMGERAFERTGRRFPLLAKLLDAADWLSVQVHPDDALAVALEGPGQFGKTEAWHFIDAAPDAQVIAGLQPGTSAAALATAIRNGKILDLVQYLDVKAGETVFMPARTIHAIGPGLLIYEVQQTSDVTYRVYDWGRKATADRKLHIDQSIAVADPSARGRLTPAPRLANRARAVVAACPYFTLELLQAQTEPLQLNTEYMTFHALTVVAGEVEIVTPSAQPIPDNAAETVRLGPYQSVVIPGACGPYEVRPLRAARILKASVED